MKAPCVFLVCVVFFAALLMSEAEAQYKWSGFFVGTLGMHTSTEIAFAGLTGYYGGSMGNKGLGIMGSYEVGGETIDGYDLRFRVVNVYFSATYILGRSMFVVSQGVSTVIGTVAEERKDYSTSTTAISYVFNTGSPFVLFGQARLQGRGLMLSAGVGF